MKLIEVPAGNEQKRFINLNNVTKVTLKKNGEIILEPAMEVLVKGDPSYEKMLQIMGITHSPASRSEQWR